MFLGAQLAPGQDATRRATRCWPRSTAWRASPVTAEELERARAQWLKQLGAGLHRPRERWASRCRKRSALGDWRLYFLERDRVRALTLADVQRVAHERLLRGQPHRRHLPADRAAAARAGAGARRRGALVKDYSGDAAAAQAEAFDPTPANLDARTQSFTLASGLQGGAAAQGHARRHRAGPPAAALRRRDSLRGQATVADVRGRAAGQGRGRLDAAADADRFDRLRAQVRFGAAAQTLTVPITTTRENLPAVMALVGRLLREPAFPADALDELRRQWLASIERHGRSRRPDRERAHRHGNPYPRGDVRYARRSRRRSRT